VARYRPQHRFRLEVKPGMTGPMQVSGHGAPSFAERAATASTDGEGVHSEISVIVPAHNAADTLDRCLSALLEQSMCPSEVIVVDDGSTDGTAETARRFGVTLLTQGQAGAGAARNRGAQAAGGKLLLFTDADCAPAHDWIERMAAAFEDEQVVAARGVCRSDQNAAAARFAQLEYDEKYRQLAAHPTVDVVSTYSAAYRRGVFARFGGFDEGFSGATSEDQELSFRLARQGLKIVFLPDAVVAHEHNVSLVGYAKRKFWIGYAKARVGRRHPVKLVRDAYTPPNLKLQVGCAYLTAFGLAVAPVRRRGLILAAMGVIGLVGSAVPFIRFGRARDPALTGKLPAFLAVRAFTLAAGLVAGTAAELERTLRSPGTRR
jgi:hypothetical protein